MAENNAEDLKEIKEMLGELLWLNSVIATELIQIAGNTGYIPSIAREDGTAYRDATARDKLRVAALDIAERYKPNTGLKEHLLNLKSINYINQR